MGNAPIEEEVKAGHKKWVLTLHLDKNRNNAAKATQLFKGLNAGYDAWKKAPMRVPPKPMADSPTEGCKQGQGTRRRMHHRKKK